MSRRIGVSSEEALSVAATEAVEPLTRRDRVRADTVREIKQTARRVLVEQGEEGLALRAVAREMGMTAPGLYRYFASREDLVEHVVADLYTEISDAMEAACAAADPATPAGQLMAASRAFRTWAMAHRHEFGLLFGEPADDPVRDRTMHEGPAHEAKERFGAIFAARITELYLTQPFPLRDELEPELREQLTECAEMFPAELPLGVVEVFLSCWIGLYGMVCMEVFGHLQFAFRDAEPMFEAELRRLGERLGIGDEYRRP
jgi:AcrR family transcriptional regulator